jgi:hypothetical protein
LIDKDGIVHNHKIKGDVLYLDYFDKGLYAVTRDKITYWAIKENDKHDSKMEPFYLETCWLGTGDISEMLKLNRVVLRFKTEGETVVSSKLFTMSTSPKLETQRQEKQIVIMKDDTSNGVSHYQIIPKYPTGQ